MHISIDTRKDPTSNKIQDDENLQTKNNPTQPRRKHNLNSAPALPRQHIQIARERDPWQQIREENVDCARDDELVEDLPVGNVAVAEVSEVLTEETEGVEGGG